MWEEPNPTTARRAWTSICHYELVYYIILPEPRFESVRKICICLRDSEVLLSLIAGIKCRDKEEEFFLVFFVLAIGTGTQLL